MTLVVTSIDPLNQVAAPNLPLAPIQYNEQYQNQLNNVFRLYFNRVDSILAQMTASGVMPPLTNYVVADLPSAVSSGVGARSFVTDALLPTFGSTVAAGGAVATPVYSDGTNWKVG